MYRSVRVAIQCSGQFNAIVRRSTGELVACKTIKPGEKILLKPFPKRAQQMPSREMPMADLDVENQSWVQLRQQNA